MGTQHLPPLSRRVCILGTLHIEAGGRVLVIPHTDARRLLALLLIQPDVLHSRETLIDLLWPDLAPQSGRRALSNALYRLSQSLGSGWIHAGSRSLALIKPAELWIDAREFLTLTHSDRTTDLHAAINIYAGDLFPEIYDDWSITPRATLHERYLSTLERLGTYAEESGQLSLALDCFQRLVQTDPLSEAGYRGVMRMLARSERYREALEYYAALERMLEDELGAEPVAETRDLANRLRAEHAIAHRTTQEPSFVGRLAERAELLRYLTQATAGCGGLIVVLGEAGIGKSCLLNEIARSAAWRRWQVAAGTGEALTIPAPYAPLPMLLAKALPRPRIQQMAQIVAPYWLAILAGLIPQVADLESSISIEDADESRLAIALRIIFEQLQRIAPHLLILDDMQWADPALWALLSRLRPVLANLRILVVLSGRDDELQNQPEAQSTLASWEEAGVPIIRLTGLSPTELAELSTSQYVAMPDADTITQLHMASGGNPLMALALLHAQGPEQRIKAQSLADLIHQRLMVLTPADQLALGAAAVIGYRFDYALWQSLCVAIGLDGPALLEQAGRLERVGLLRLEAEGYRFAHDTLRSYVYAQHNTIDLCRLHTAALAAYQRHAPAATLALLAHAEHAGMQAQIAQYALRAGEQALRAVVPRQARAYYAKALMALPPDDVRGRFTALRGQAKALETLGERAAQADVVGQLQLLAHALGDVGIQAEVAILQANLAWITGQFIDAQSAALAGLALAEQANNQQQKAQMLEIAGRAARDLGNYSSANTFFADAQQCYRNLADPLGVAWIDGMLGLVAQRQGRFHEAVAYQQRALEVHRERGDLYSELRVTTAMAIAFWMLGDYLEAQRIFERTLHISREVDDRRMEEASLANLGALADILGDYTTAVVLKEQALALSRTANNLMGIAVGLCNLGITTYKLGRLDDSLTAFDEALAIDQATGRRQGQAYCLTGRGVTLGAMGRFTEARASLEAGRAIRVDLAERDGIVVSEAELALVAIADNDLSAAHTSLDAALAALASDDRADVRELVHYAAYRVWSALGDPALAVAHLGRAAAAMEELASVLPTEAYDRLLRDDPLNRQVRSAEARHAQSIEVPMARVNTPLGRPLDANDYVTVRWTISLPGDTPLAEPARRNRVLTRLLIEAAAQGAAPTDDDLAAALGVSRRTILRVMANLTKTGSRLPTRRRRG